MGKLLVRDHTYLVLGLFSLGAKLSDFWVISSQVTGILLYKFFIKKTFMGRII